MTKTPLFVVTFAALTAACTTPEPTPDTDVPPVPVANLIAEGEIDTTASGQCFARTAPPTRTRIVEEQIMIAPGVREPDGSFSQPPIFRNQTRPVTEPIGEGTRFETLCPPEYTPERIATLQRALKARLAYSGPITSVLDGPTRAAIQAFQVDQGFDSPLIARQLAETLGVVALGRDAI